MRKIHRLLSFIIALCMICSLNSLIVFAEELQPIQSTNTVLSNGVDDNESKLAEKIIKNDARNGIVKIITGYEFEDTSFDKWVVGYGFLITKEQVLASRTVAIIDENSSLYRTIKGTRGSSYSRFGINLNDYQTTIKHVRTYILLDEGKVEAQVNMNAIGDSFALLNLSQRINSKDVLTLSETPLEDGMNVYAIGPNNIDLDDAKLSDIKPAKKSDFFGKLSSITNHRKTGLSEYVEFKGNFTHLSLAPGCPLITKNQIVVGLITDGRMGNGSAVDIKTIEDVLDRANIEYAVVKDDEMPVEPIPTDTLENLLKDVETIDRSQFTKESLEELDSQIKATKEMLGERSISSNRVEKQYEQLSQAYAGLRKVDHKGVYIKIAIAVIIIVILVVAFIYIKRMIHNIGKDEFEIEDERLEKEAEKERKRQERKSKKQEVINTNYDNHVPENDSGEDKTGVLDGQTGVLHENTTKAWLVHESGNRITVNKARFIIGKAQGVDYRINNNTVSRNHCRILMRGDEFYVEDLGSTNGTFIDGERLSENVPSPISNGQKLTLSDENFTFEISGG